LKTIKIVLILTVAALLVVSSILYRQDRKENSERIQSISSVSKQASELERQIDVLKRKAESSGKNKTFENPPATVELLIEAPTTYVFTSLQPFMEDYDFVPVIAVNSVNFPGENGMMTQEQFLQLMDRGWRVCMRRDLDDMGPVDAERTELEGRLNELELTGPEVIWFSPHSEATSSDAAIPESGRESGADVSEDELKNAGYRIAVSLHEKADKNNAWIDPAELWRTDSVSVESEDAWQLLQATEENGGNLVITVDPHKLEAGELFEDDIQRVLDYCRRQGDKLQMTSLSDAFEKHSMTEIQLKEYREQTSSRESAEQEIRRLEEELQKLYSEYEKSSVINTK